MTAAAVTLGLAVFLAMAAHRRQPPATPRDALSASEGSFSAPALPAAPAAIGEMEAAARGATIAVVPAPPEPPPLPPPPVPKFFPMPVQASAGPIIDAMGPRRTAPVLVVDLADPETAARLAAANAAATGGQPQGARTPQGLSGEEQFAARIGAAEPERVRATFLRNRSLTVPQGAVVPAVLETALNSDLPGPTRAVVSGDVRSFDGSQILIPRGSRLIGQYRSGVALGASRAFVIWTRILRPDGVSVQIGSPGTDTLGRAGLGGSVDRHFFERFGGAVLLSVINAGLTSNRPSTQVVIGSSSDAGAVAAAAASGQAVAPTINVPQGAPIRVFVARDLDFSPVEPGS